MARKPATAKKADLSAAKCKTARKPTAKTKATSKVTAPADGYQPIMARQARLLWMKGLSEEGIAYVFGVSLETLARWASENTKKWAHYASA